MKKKTLLYPMAFILLILNVCAVGIVPAIHEVRFKPGETYSFTFYARADGGQQTPVSIFMNGELSKYVEPKDYIYPNYVSKTVPESGIIPFEFTVKMPEDANPSPGRNILSVYVSDAVASGGTIGVTTAVQSWLVFVVPYPGKYADVSFDIPNTNVNQSTTVNLNIVSRGQEPLVDTKATIEIRDQTESLKDTIHFNNVNVAPGETKTLTETLHTELYTPGKYTGKADYFYAENKKEVKAEFRVGTLQLNLLRNTEKLVEGTINKFEVVIENQWNNDLEEVYATGTIYAQNFKTPTIVMQSFGESTLMGYVDTTGFQLGPADARINFFFKEKGSEKIYTSEHQVKIEIVKEEKEKPPKEEEAKQENKPDGLLILALLAVVILVVIFDVIWLRRRKKE
jgi:hypothetical protein